ncbi:helix-turn-helix domain-containing protein [Microvirgula aerodenitrificans]|uniref:helix-turn-helix domain-containing protein n=2 Tax=Microvirgula aerodenitrificans TaxID=57480 RepID=UPI00248DA857|nr:helix-turn-helix domain-containing protein [Microvirgula aerodenitrificans]
MTPVLSAEMTLPAAREAQLAGEGRRALAACLASGPGTQRLQIFDEQNQSHQLDLPISALRLLLDILAEQAEGNTVKVVPVHAELTTQEAADLLNVSRPHLVKLLDNDALPCHRTGKHRRIRLTDLMRFKAERDHNSEQAMAALASQAQALGMGYD